MFFEIPGSAHIFSTSLKDLKVPSAFRQPSSSLPPLTCFQGRLLIGAILLEYLCGKYMTMMRIALYKNRSLEAALDMGSMTTVTAYVLLSLGLLYGGFLLFSVWKEPRGTCRSAAPQMSLILLAWGTACFTLLQDPSLIRTYYSAFFLMTLTVLIQLIKVTLLPLKTLRSASGS